MSFLMQALPRRSSKLLYVNTPHIMRLKNNYTLDNSRKRCLVFPGQGAQYVGMCKDLYDEFPYIKELIQECDEIVGYSLSNTMFNGDIQDLTTTIKAQPAVLIHSLSLLKVLQTEYNLFNLEQNPNDFNVAMGLSLGEYSALTASKCINTIQDAVFLVDKRARAMQECCINNKPENEDLQQKMLAIMHDGSLTIDKLQDIINNLDVMNEDNNYVADIANYNSPRQVVISGHKIALDCVQNELKKDRIKSKYINTGGSFHSKLMVNARNKLNIVLENADINLPFAENTVISNVNATIINNTTYSDGNIIKQLLCNQVCTAVNWYPSVLKCIQELGITEFIEIGPKPTISGMLRDICKINDIQDIQISNFDILADLKKLQ